MSKRNPYIEWLSGWVITYNTNKSDPRYINIVDQAWNEMLPRLVSFVRTYSSPTVEVLWATDAHTIEIGPRYHKIHVHSNLRMESKGLAMLDYKAMGRFLNDRVAELWYDKYSHEKDFRPFTRGYLNGQAIKNLNAERLIKAYLEKAPVKNIPVTLGLLSEAPLARTKKTHRR